MSTPQAANPRRGPRKQHRPPNSSAIPLSDGSSEVNQNPSNLDLPNTPPSEYPKYYPSNAISVPVTEPPANVGEDGNQKKKRGRPKKQPPAPPQAETTTPPVVTPPVTARVSNHRPANSQNMVLSPERMKSTPLKQAYAGPTFHASPAASSVPMPSFLARNSSNTTDQASAQTDSRRKESKSGDSPPTEISASQPVARDREASPLDFLFQAAIAAKSGHHLDSLKNASENDLSHVRAISNPPASRQQDSPAHRTRNHTRHPTEGSMDQMFPLEMDGSSTPDMAIGPAFATPYKDRMNALRSGSTPSHEVSHDPEEYHRKAKSDALKKLLLKNPQPQRPASASARLREVSNPFDPPASIPNGVPQRHNSGPSSPVSYTPNYTNGIYQNAYPQYPFPQQNFACQANGSPKPRTPSSNLRREVTSRSPAVELPTPHYQISTRSTPRGSTPAKEKSAEAKSMEDDLRRILKLNLTD